MINSQFKSLGLKDSLLTKTEAKTQNSLNNTNDFDYRLKVRHVVDIYIYIYIYIYMGVQAKTCSRVKFGISIFGPPKAALWQAVCNTFRRRGEYRTSGHRLSDLG